MAMERKPRSPITCFYCNEEGHMKKDCPKKRDRIICFNCNEAGHIKRNCPKLSHDNPMSGTSATGFSKTPKPSKQKYTTPSDGARASKTLVSPDDGARPSKTLISHSDVGASKTLVSPSDGVQLSEDVRPLHISSPEQNLSEKSSNSRPSIASQGHASTNLIPCNADFPTERPANEQPKTKGGLLDEIKDEKRNTPVHGQRQPLPPFVDTHCHLEYVFERYEHKGNFSEFTREWNYPRNFDGCIASFCDPAAFSSFGVWSDLLVESNVWATFGIHPHNARYYNQGLEDKVLKCLEHEKCLAFGEIGLDYGDHSPSDLVTQREVLTRQLQLGVTLEKPFVLHCRNAEEDLLQILTTHVPSEWKIHLHCYTGKLSVALRYLDHYPNLYLGVTGNVTYDKSFNVHTVAQQVPLERLLVETDAPYNTPRNLPRAGRCRFSHPAHAYYAAKEIASLRRMELSEVLHALRNNTRKMYGI